MKWKVAWLRTALKYKSYAIVPPCVARRDVIYDRDLILVQAEDIRPREA